jgi:hypothetical protein
LQSNLRVNDVDNLGLFSAGAILFCMSHILLRDRLPKHDIERKIEGRRKRGRTRKELKEKRGYWN